MASRVAVVTGANRGIGLEIARQLAAQDIEVILTARNLEQAQVQANKLTEDGSKVVAHALDVTSQESVDDLLKFVQSQFGRWDILINNAGIASDRSGNPPSQIPLELVQETLNTNLFGAWRMAQAALHLMKPANYGRIVNLSSGMGEFASLDQHWVAYRLSKTALNAFTVMLASELRGIGIAVNAMCPGWVRTDMGGRGATRSVAQGADTATWLATLPDKAKSGGFYRDRKPISW